jgi:hypothetical protein
MGGQDSPRALPFCAVVGIIAAFVGAPFPFVNDAYMATGIIWFVLFIGGIILPLLTGVMLNQMQENQRPFANSFANLSYNLLGYAPAP